MFSLTVEHRPDSREGANIARDQRKFIEALMRVPNRFRFPFSAKAGHNQTCCTCSTSHFLSPDQLQGRYLSPLQQALPRSQTIERSLQPNQAAVVGENQTATTFLVEIRLQLKRRPPLGSPRVGCRPPAQRINQNTLSPLFQRQQQLITSNVLSHTVMRFEDVASTIFTECSAAAAVYALQGTAAACDQCVAPTSDSPFLVAS